MGQSALNMVRQLLQLERIEQALLRIDQGTYGYCAACKGPISLERLENDPTEECCAACDMPTDRKPFMKKPDTIPHQDISG